MFGRLWYGWIEMGPLGTEAGERLPKAITGAAIHRPEPSYLLALTHPSLCMALFLYGKAPLLQLFQGPQSPESTPSYSPVNVSEPTT